MHPRQAQCHPRRPLATYNIYFFILVNLLAWSLLSPLARAQNDAGTWFTRAPLPTPRQEMPLVALEHRVYVLGGIDADRISSEVVEVYDPATDAWTEAASLPPTLHHPAAAAANGQLYVFGGYISAFTPTNRVFAYNPATNAWTEKASMPAPRGALTAVTVDDKIFVMGGERAGEALAINAMYDPASDTWETRSAMPTAREHLAAAAVDGKVYVVGGRTRLKGILFNLDTVEAYDPFTDTWQTGLASLPEASGGLAATALHGRLYAFGGEFFTGNTGVYAMNAAYEPETDQWDNLAPMPLPRHGIGAVAVADTIYIIGGGPRAGYATTDVNAGFLPPSQQATTAGAHPEPPAPVLRPGYPNPFRSSTTLSFTLTRPGSVALSVVDIQGAVVASLLKGTHAAGQHEVTWQAAPLPAGVYFAVLRTATGTLTRPLVKR